MLHFSAKLYKVDRSETDEEENSSWGRQICFQRYLQTPSVCDTDKWSTTRNLQSSNYRTTPTDLCLTKNDFGLSPKDQWHRTTTDQIHQGISFCVTKAWFSMVLVPITIPVRFPMHAHFITKGTKCTITKCTQKPLHTVPLHYLPLHDVPGT